MMRGILTSDRLSGLIWLALGIGFCTGSIGLKLWIANKPGAGLLPFVSGALLGVLGLILIFSSSRTKVDVRQSGQEAPSQEARKQLLFTFVILLAYILLFEFLGFVFSTFVFFFLCFKLTEPKRWIIPLLSSGSVAVLGHLVFSVWLKIALPGGIFNF